MYHTLEENKQANCKNLSIQIILYLNGVRDCSCWSQSGVTMTQKHRLSLSQIMVMR